MRRAGRMARQGRRAALHRLVLGACWPAGVPALSPAQSAAPATLALSTARGLWLLDVDANTAPRRLGIATTPIVKHALTAWRQTPTLLAAPDGQLLRIDPRSLAVTARRDFGQPLHGALASADGQWLLLAPDSGDHLVLVDAQLNIARVLPNRTLDGRPLGAARCLLDLPHRRSFVAVFAQGGELWEVSYDPGAEPIFDGLVHDYRMGEGLAKAGFLAARRNPLGPQEAHPASWFAAPGLPWLAGLTGAASAPLLTVWHLDVRRAIATLPVPAACAPASAAVFSSGSLRVLALPDRQQPHLVLLDAGRWAALAPLPLPAPAVQVCANAASARVAVLCRPRGGQADVVLALDPAGRQIIASWQLEGSDLLGLAHTPDGRHLLALADGPAQELWVLDALRLLPRRQFVLS